MKTKLILSLIITCTMFFACKKENNAPGNSSGSSSTAGTIYFNNTQSDPYTIYLDGTNMGILQGGKTIYGYTVTSGISHAIKVIQYSGYVFSPSVYTGTATVNPGGSVTWEF